MTLHPVVHTSCMRKKTIRNNNNKIITKKIKKRGKGRGSGGKDQECSPVTSQKKRKKKKKTTQQPTSFFLSFLQQNWHCTANTPLVIDQGHVPPTDDHYLYVHVVISLHISEHYTTMVYGLGILLRDPNVHTTPSPPPHIIIFHAHFQPPTHTY